VAALEPEGARTAGPAGLMPDGRRPVALKGLRQPATTTVFLPECLAS